MADPTITFQYQYFIEVTNPSTTVDLLQPSDTFKVTFNLDQTGGNSATVTYTDPTLFKGQIVSIAGAGGIVPGSADYHYVGGMAGNAGIVVFDDTSDTYYLFTNQVYPASNVTTYNYDSSEILCLLENTLIITRLGEKPVQNLVIGDEVLVESGEYVKLRWIGVQTIAPAFAGRDSWPVKISEGALGYNSPDKDLYISQDHAIFFEGLLIVAGALINGTTITLEKPTESTIKYYGLDLGLATIHPVHNLMVGSLGGITREHFDNYQEWLDSGYELIDEPLMFPRVRSSYQLPTQVRVKVSA